MTHIHNYQLLPATKNHHHIMSYSIYCTIYIPYIHIAHILRRFVVGQSLWWNDHKHAPHGVLRKTLQDRCSLYTNLGLYVSMQLYIYIWLVVWNMFYFSIIYGIILPIDFHIFQDGWNHQPDIVRKDSPQDIDNSRSCRSRGLIIDTRSSEMFAGFHYRNYLDISTINHLEFA